MAPLLRTASMASSGHGLQDQPPPPMQGREASSRGAARVLRLRGLAGLMGHLRNYPVESGLMHQASTAICSSVRMKRWGELLQLPSFECEAGPGCPSQAAHSRGLALEGSHVAFLGLLQLRQVTVGPTGPLGICGAELSGC